MTDQPAEYADGGRRELEFAAEYVDSILDGEKTATIRYDLDDWPSPGDRLQFVTPDRAPFATVDLFGIVDCRLHAAPVALDAFRAEYPTRDPSEIAEQLSEHYTRGFGPQTRVAVIVWENLTEVRDGE